MNTTKIHIVKNTEKAKCGRELRDVAYIHHYDGAYRYNSKYRDDLCGSCIKSAQSGRI